MKKLQNLQEQQGPMMQELLEKNLTVSTRNSWTILKGKAEEAVFLKHDAVLRTFGILEAELFPEGALQERLYTPYTYLKSDYADSRPYPFDLLKWIERIKLKCDGTHK